jgi:hypothetical protein
VDAGGLLVWSEREKREKGQKGGRDELEKDSSENEDGE